MAVSVALLSIGILWVASGSVGPLVTGVVSGFGGLVNSVGNVVSSPESTAPPTIADAPTIVVPDQLYTNEETVDVTVTLPPAVIGLKDFTLRLWVTLAEQPTQLVDEIPVGPTAALTVPGVALAKGRNDVQASIIGPGGESELSDIATWILDQSRPVVKISTPKESSSTTKDSVNVKGKTQGRSTVRLKNDLNGAIVTTTAGSDGLFEARITVDPGINTITISVTDLAGNPNTATITVRRGSGEMRVALTGTAYQFTARRLPKQVSFTVVVTGPDGRRVSGATALFTVTIPGLEAIVSGEIETNGSGSATFTTRIPKGALPGSGLASVLVTTDAFGQGTDRQVLTVR